jgi:hypothetical protein
MFWNVLECNTLGSVAGLTSYLAPLEIVYQNIPEDYALVFRNEHDGFYYLRAAMVCSSVGCKQPLDTIFTLQGNASPICGLCLKELVTLLALR